MIYRTSIGLDVHARSIAAEIGDFPRFPSAPAFMSYLGLVPSEDSSGGKVERGGITRTGNRHVRTLLVEPAWHHARRWSPLLPTEVAAPPHRTGYRKTAPAHGNMGLGGLGT
ncbi:transposase [Enorma phocaeensis]|uniref:transposase n=1 Tax=Enorma phocaeensis TaxID=1871019 RepID=UPI003F507899